MLVDELGILGVEGRHGLRSPPRRTRGESLGHRRIAFSSSGRSVSGAAVRAVSAGLGRLVRGRHRSRPIPAHDLGHGTRQIPSHPQVNTIARQRDLVRFSWLETRCSREVGTSKIRLQSSMPRVVATIHRSDPLLILRDPICRRGAKKPSMQNLERTRLVMAHPDDYRRSMP